MIADFTHFWERNMRGRGSLLSEYSEHFVDRSIEHGHDHGRQSHNPHACADLVLE